MGRVVVFIMGAASIFLAQQWIGLGSAIEFVVQLLSITTAGLLGLFALGLFSTRATRAGAWLGIAVCVLFTAWATLTSVSFPSVGHPLLNLGRFNYTLEPFLIGVVNHVLLFIVGFGASFVFGRRMSNLGDLTVWSRGRSSSA